MTGNIHSVETFGTVDGPGIRYVIFMQGCNMRCAYCHNPDSWDIGCGEQKTVGELVEDIVKYKRYIEGITISGGEPLLQIDFITNLFEKIKQEGLTTCLDTSGAVFNSGSAEFINKLKKLLSLTDLVLLDIKHIDEYKHIKLTGHTNKNILEFASFLDEQNVDMWLRYVLVPTINNDEETLLKWKDFASTLNCVKKIEILPYHKLALEKYEKLGIEYKLAGVPEPTTEDIKRAEKILIGKENR